MGKSKFLGSSNNVFFLDFRLVKVLGLPKFEELKIWGAKIFRDVKCLGRSMFWGNQSFGDFEILGKAKFWGGQNFKQVKNLGM